MGEQLKAIAINIFVLVMMYLTVFHQSPIAENVIYFLGWLSIVMLLCMVFVSHALPDTDKDKKNLIELIKKKVNERPEWVKFFIKTVTIIEAVFFAGMGWFVLAVLFTVLHLSFYGKYEESKKN